MPHQVPNVQAPKVEKQPSNGKQPKVVGVKLPSNCKENVSIDKELMSKLMRKGIKSELSGAEKAMLLAGVLPVLPLDCHWICPFHLPFGSCFQKEKSS